MYTRQSAFQLASSKFYRMSEKEQHFQLLKTGNRILVIYFARLLRGSGGLESSRQERACTWPNLIVWNGRISISLNKFLSGHIHNTVLFRTSYRISNYLIVGLFIGTLIFNISFRILRSAYKIFY